MAESDLTLSSLLGLPDEGFPRQVLAAGLSQEELGSLKGKISGTMAGMHWEHVEQTVCAKISEQLNQDPIEIMADAWGKYKVLTESVEQSKTGEAVFLTLEEHSITSELHPYVELQLGPQTLKKIEFDIEITLQLKGLILRIEDGKIKSVEAGSCQGSGEIRVKSMSIWKHDFKPIDLPGKINLGSGIAIH